MAHLPPEDSPAAGQPPTVQAGFQSGLQARLDRSVWNSGCQSWYLKDGRNPVPPWRLHDLRRTLATGFQRLGVRFEVTEAVLNHVGGSRSGVAGIYQRHD